MTVHRVLLAVLATLVLAAASAFAHDDFRIIGTVVKSADATLTVKTREGKTLSVRLDKQTEISRDKKKVDASALKAGLSVVVDAYGDTADDSLALEIRIVPPIAAR